MAPWAVEAYKYEVGILTRQGQYATAVALTQKAPPELAKTVVLSKLQGLAVMKRRHYREAVSYFLRAAQEAPQDYYLQSNLASSYLRLKRYPEAISAAQSALALHPNSAYSWYYRGTAEKGLRNYAEMKRCYNESIRCCEEAIDLKPKASAPYLLLAAIYLRLNNYRQLWHWFKKAVYNAED